MCASAFSVQRVARATGEGLQLLVVVSVLASLEDHRAEHEQGDNEDDEPLPDHGDYSVGWHEAREFLEPANDHDNVT